MFLFVFVTFWTVLSSCDTEQKNNANKWHYVVFFLKIGGHKSFCGATDTPILDFWWCLPWVSKPEQAALFTLGRGIHVKHSLRFTFSVTPANLLVSTTYLQAGIGGIQNRDLLSYAGLANKWQYVGFVLHV